MEDTIYPDKIQTPEEDELTREIVSRYKRCETHYDEWKEVAEEDYRFCLGDQWTLEEKEKLDEQKRPCLTFNRIKPLINLVAGYQRENAARIKVTPEGGEDRIFSEVCDKLLFVIDKWSKLAYKLGYLFDDGLYCGKGHIEAYLDYNVDPVKGELKYILNGPYQIMIDPECKEYDINEGAEFLFKTTRFTKRKLKEMYPKKKNLIDGFKTDTDNLLDNTNISYEGDADNYGNNPNKVTVVKEHDLVDDTSEYEPDVKFTHKEYWYKKYVKKYFVIDRETSIPRKHETEEEAQAFAREQGDAKIIERTVPEMWVAAMTCGHILQDIKSPFEPHYSGYAIFRFIADWAPSGNTELDRVQGLTRSLKDPQREKNKAKSQFLHIINTQANSGWIGDDNALTNEGWEELRTLGAVPGVTIRKQPGTELREIIPKAPAMAQTLREQGADEEFKQISNVNPDLLGFQEKTSSGRAIALRIKQAVLALVRIFSNYRYTKEMIGRFMLQMIPILFDVKKIEKVLGPNYMKQAQNEQYPEGLHEGHLAAFLQMIKDHKYDVSVTEADQAATTRFEVFSQLMELAKTGYQLPIEVILEFMDIPNSEEVKKKVEETQQQAMQMQMASKAK